MFSMCLYLPSYCKPSKDLHHLETEFSFPRVVLEGHVEWVPEHVFYFIAVHHPHPFAPERRARSLQKTRPLLDPLTDIQLLTSFRVG